MGRCYVARARKDRFSLQIKGAPNHKMTVTIGGRRYTAQEDDLQIDKVKRKTPVKVEWEPVNGAWADFELEQAALTNARKGAVLQTTGAASFTFLMPGCDAQLTGTTKLARVYVVKQDALNPGFQASVVQGDGSALSGTAKARWGSKAENRITGVLPCAVSAVTFQLDWGIHYSDGTCKRWEGLRLNPGTGYQIVVDYARTDGGRPASAVSKTYEVSLAQGATATFQVRAHQDDDSGWDTVNGMWTGAWFNLHDLILHV